MKSFKAKIIDPIGLHARPASLLVQCATKFKSDVTLFSAGKSANLKSIMSVMALAVKQNQEIEIKVNGVDEEAAINKIEQEMKSTKLI